MSKTVAQYKNIRGNLYINCPSLYDTFGGMHGVAKKFNSTQFAYFYQAILFYALTGQCDFVEECYK
jgi:hypothetical protein